MGIAGGIGRWHFTPRPRTIFHVPHRRALHWRPYPGAWPGGALSGPRALIPSRTAWRRTSIVEAYRQDASAAATVSRPVQSSRAAASRQGGLSACRAGWAVGAARAPSRPLPMRSGQKCRSPSDCQSESCIDGTCGEAKQCASRFFTDTFGGTVGLAKSSFVKSPQAANLIKCGQCLCEPCPVSNLLLGCGGPSFCRAIH